MKLIKTTRQMVMGTVLVCLAFTQVAMAAPEGHLQHERLKTIHEYIHNLQAANPEKMAKLFEQDGTVVSTSKGQLDAINFFNGFLPEIATASIQTGGVYHNDYTPDDYVAHFFYNFVLKDGSTGGGPFADDFKFAPDSSKLQSVHMFEKVAK